MLTASYSEPYCWHRARNRAVRATDRRSSLASADNCSRATGSSSFPSGRKPVRLLSSALLVAHDLSGPIRRHPHQTARPAGVRLALPRRVSLASRHACPLARRGHGGTCSFWWVIFRTSGLFRRTGPAGATGASSTPVPSPVPRLRRVLGALGARWMSSPTSLCGWFSARLRREREDRRARYASRDHAEAREVCRHMDDDRDAVRACEGRAAAVHDRARAARRHAEQAARDASSTRTRARSALTDWELTVSSARDSLRDARRRVRRECRP